MWEFSVHIQDNCSAKLTWTTPSVLFLCESSHLGRGRLVNILLQYFFYFLVFDTTDFDDAVFLPPINGYGKLSCLQISFPL